MFRQELDELRDTVFVLNDRLNSTSGADKTDDLSAIPASAERVVQQLPKSSPITPSVRRINSSSRNTNGKDANRNKQPTCTGSCRDGGNNKPTSKPRKSRPCTFPNNPEDFNLTFDETPTQCPHPYPHESGAAAELSEHSDENADQFKSSP